MSISAVTNNIVSQLGSSSSLLPMWVKDTINSTGLTYYSYNAGGKLEGKDRLIDEFGTQAIWLLGLPFFKSIADKTIYKLKKLDPKVDIRVVDSKDHIEFAKNVLTPGIEQDAQALKSIDDAAKRFSEFKKLFYTKFGLATTLTFASYMALTKYKQKSTEKAVIKQYEQKKATEALLTETIKENKHFKDFSEVAFAGKKNKPSFKGGFSAFMFDPVKNLMIVDAGITTERFSKSRNKHELTEYAIKEGSVIFFLYFAGGWIQKGIQKAAKSLFKTPVELDYRVINSDIFKEKFGKEELEQEVKDVKKLKTQKAILNYIADNTHSTIVKSAINSDIIGTFKNGAIDPRNYIDTNEFKHLATLIEEFTQKARESGLSLKDFLKKAKYLKAGAIATNIGMCCTALGIIMPKAIYKYRMQKHGTTDFHVVNQIHERLEQKDSSDNI